MQPILMYPLIYLLGFPILLELFFFAQKKLIVQKSEERNAKRKVPKSPENLPKPLRPVFYRRFKFAVKDRRFFMAGKKPRESGIQNRVVILIAWVAGLVLALVAGVQNKPIFIAWALIPFIFAMIVAHMVPKPILQEQDRITKRMFDVLRTKMPFEGEWNHNGNIQILEWRDTVVPALIQFKLPLSFAEESQDNVRRHFNQFFGRESEWVAHVDAEKGYLGWDYDKGHATLIAKPPLPTKAPWSDHYVLDPGVAWSFFPLGLGVEGGLELPNPNKNGEIENVLGFDVSGLQEKFAEKAGYKLSPTIVTSPQALFGGATGGGKAHPIDTPILAIRP